MRCRILSSLYGKISLRAKVRGRKHPQWCEGSGGGGDINNLNYFANIVYINKVGKPLVEHAHVGVCSDSVTQ